jgi:hypothetical protein
VSEVVDLLQRELEFLVAPKPVFEEVTYGIAPLQDPSAKYRQVPYCARGIHRHDGIEVAPVVCLGERSHYVLHVRRRGLVGHRLLL